mmetsp:Transcript_11698/g.23740  ORF Transcript_11698/g.23740 Transcript_11698/m.23740 type:complete len:442 (+) Transcript_11698:103-1428(+)
MIPTGKNDNFDDNGNSWGMLWDWYSGDDTAAAFLTNANGTVHSLGDSGAALSPPMISASATSRMSSTSVRTTIKTTSTTGTSPSSLLPMTVSSSTSSNDNCTVPYSFVSTLPDFNSSVESSATSSPGDLCRLEEGVDDEQERDSSPQRPSPKTIHTNPNNLGQTHPSLSLSNSQVGRKAVAAIYAVNDEGGDKHNEGDITEDCEEDIKLNDGCSDYEIQRPEVTEAEKLQPQAMTDIKWNASYQMLIEYKAQHGSTMIESKHNPRLANWAKYQRKLRTKEQLLSSRFLLLESIGFAWALKRKSTVNAKNWESRFEMLLHYKAQHGHTRVPTVYSKNLQLGRWVQNQRRNYFTGNLSSNRISILESVGFAWIVGDKKFDSMIILLLEYKSQHGDTMVPNNYHQDRKLGKWVQKQRLLYWNKSLSSKHIVTLESIGFVWCTGE